MGCMRVTPLLNCESIRIMKKIDSVLLLLFYCRNLEGQKGYTRRCRLAVHYNRERQHLNIKILKNTVGATK